MDREELGALLPGSAHFQVIELPAYELSGAGEHLYVELESEGSTTEAVAARLARACDVAAGAIGFAGRKDRHARTRQWFSVLGGDEQSLGPLESSDIRVLCVSRHRNKLRLGHLRGNRFRLGLTLASNALPELRTRLARLATHGLENRFGTQRFGSGGGNLRIARAWGGGDPRAALAAIVAPAGDWRLGDPLPAHRGSDARGRALAALTRRPDDVRAALRAAGRRYRQLIASAAQSAIFNAVLDARRDAGRMYELRQGDVARRERGRPFLCRQEELAELNRDAAPGALEVSATGPLPGTQRFGPSPEVDAEERAWSAQVRIEWSWFLKGRPLESPGDRRPLVVACLEPPRLESDSSEAWLEVALPRGSYATELLRQVGIAVRRPGAHARHSGAPSRTGPEDGVRAASPQRP